MPPFFKLTPLFYLGRLESHGFRHKICLTRDNVDRPVPHSIHLAHPKYGALVATDALQRGGSKLLAILRPRKACKFA